MASIQDILRPIVITKVVSRLAESSSDFLSVMGMQPGGPNTGYYGEGRDTGYYVFNNVRTIGKGRAPGTAAGRRARNPIGRVTQTFPRMHEEVYMLAEEINNLAQIDNPAVRDEAGANYIRRQMKPPAQRLANFRTALAVGMLRDSLYVTVDGDDWYFSYTSSGSLFQISAQMPSGNKSQLNMLGTGSIIDTSWLNPSANIPLHLSNIDAAMTNLTGFRLGLVVVPSNVWQNVITNDYVAAQAGIAAPPFQMYERKEGTGPDGNPLTTFRARLNCMPGVEWYVTNEGLEIGAEGSETFTTHVGSNNAMFMPSPTKDWCEMREGSEQIADYDGAPWVKRQGQYSWTKNSFNPTGIEVFTLDNALAVNYVPSANCYATVIF